MASSHSQPSHPPRIKSTTCSQGKHECPGIPLRCSHKEAPRLDSSVMSTGPSHKNAAMCDPRKASYARSGKLGNAGAQPAAVCNHPGWVKTPYVKRLPFFSNPGSW
eukprot:359116-Chlamydomonas_euryale.AAC.4